MSKPTQLDTAGVRLRRLFFGSAIMRTIASQGACYAWALRGLGREEELILCEPWF